MQSKFRALVCVLLLSIAGSGSVFAERADRDKPMNFEADALKADELKRVRELRGNVVISKGTLLMRADQIVVRDDAEGFQYALASSTGGKRSFFRQKREGVDEYIEAEAEQMEYDGKADTVKFQKRAVVRRYRGATLADETVGAVIVLDNRSETFSVDGGTTTAASGNAAGGRVRGVLTPNRGAASAPASPAVERLRPASQMPAEKK
jgi:lipopolysaccharide export system protein LptA